MPGIVYKAEDPLLPCKHDYLCVAKKGSDAPTGLGSPDGTGAFSARTGVRRAGTPTLPPDGNRPHRRVGLPPASGGAAGPFTRWASAALAVAARGP
jgi:hypothetical protein